MTDMTNAPADLAAPVLLPNRAGFIGTMEQFLNALGVIASRKGTDGVIAAVALEVLDRRAHPAAPAEVEGLVVRLRDERLAMTRDEAATALTALQAENARLLSEVATLKRTYNQLFDACAAEQARAEKAEAERDALESLHGRCGGCFQPLEECNCVKPAQAKLKGGQP